GVEEGGAGSSLLSPYANDRPSALFWTSRRPTERTPLSMHPDLSPRSDNRGLQETTTPWSSPRTGRGLSPESAAPPCPARAVPAPRHRPAGRTTTTARRWLH